MSAHTPGPWHVRGTFIDDSRGYSLASILERDVISTPANARLIAVAPRMLDLVRDIARSEQPLPQYAIEARSILLFLENHND